MSNNWWANKLGQPASTSSTPPTRQAPSEVYIPRPGDPNTRVSYNPDIDQLVSKAASARDAERCPNCMSGNYMAQTGQRKRCYDCGYPIVQSGSGAGMPSGGGGGATIAAKQVNQGGGFNPNVIVDRIG